MHVMGVVVGLEGPMKIEKVGHVAVVRMERDQVYIHEWVVHVLHYQQKLEREGPRFTMPWSK